MGVQNSFENAERALRRPMPSHPFAHGSFGLWVVQRPPAPPLGWVVTADAGNAWEFVAYAYCRDELNKRPWLGRYASLNSAVAAMLQHEPEIRALIARSRAEPASPGPAPPASRGPAPSASGPEPASSGPASQERPSTPPRRAAGPREATPPPEGPGRLKVRPPEGSVLEGPAT